MASKLQPKCQLKEQYADIQHGSNSYQLSFGESRHSTQLQFQAASKLDLLLILSSSSWKASPVGNPTPHAKERLGRHTFSTVLTCTMSPKRKMVSPMRGAAIWSLSTFLLPKLKREIR